MPEDGTWMEERVPYFGAVPKYMWSDTAFGRMSAPEDARSDTRFGSTAPGATAAPTVGISWPAPEVMRFSAPTRMPADVFWLIACMRSSTRSAKLLAP